MIKKTIFEEYVAPELEVISTVVEAGFSASMSVDSLEEEDFGTY